MPQQARNSQPAPNEAHTKMRIANSFDNAMRLSKCEAYAVAYVHNRQTDKSSRQTDRHTNRQTDRQTDRETERQTETDKPRDRQTDR